MSDTFYSPSTLIHDRRFLLSVTLCAVTAISLSWAGVNLILEQKISVKPIGEIEFVSNPGLSPTQPISQIANAPISTGNSPPAKPTVWSGYLVDVQKLCALGKVPPSDSVVIVKTGDGWRAGTTELGPRACNLAPKLGQREALYATSDKPFANVASEQRYVAINRTEHLAAQ